MCYSSLGQTQIKKQQISTETDKQGQREREREKGREKSHMWSWLRAQREIGKPKRRERKEEREEEEEEEEKQKKNNEMQGKKKLVFSFSLSSALKYDEFFFNGKSSDKEVAIFPIGEKLYQRAEEREREKGKKEIFCCISISYVLRGFVRKK